MVIESQFDPSWSCEAHFCIWFVHFSDRSLSGVFLLPFSPCPFLERKDCKHFNLYVWLACLVLSEVCWHVKSKLLELSQQHFCDKFSYTWLARNWNIEFRFWLFFFLVAGQNSLQMWPRTSGASLDSLLSSVDVESFISRYSETLASQVLALVQKSLPSPPS
jgi:hypothetical protein